MTKHPPIKVPTTVIHGTEDGASLPQSSEGQESSLVAGYTRTVIPVVGHFMQRERPDVVVAAVLGESPRAYDAAMRPLTNLFVLVPLVTLAGCMAFPWSTVYFHDYEGDVARQPIHAVEDGRRVTFAQLSIKHNISPPYNVGWRTVFVEKATKQSDVPDALPVWTSARSISDQTLLRRAFEELPTYRDPEATAKELREAPGGVYAWWADGYVVSTRPLIIARPPGAGAVDASREAVASDRANQQSPQTSTPVDGHDASLRTSAQQDLFAVAYVEPAALGERVDTLQVRVAPQGVRVIRLPEPMTIDALLDRLARPDAPAALAAGRLP